MRRIETENNGPFQLKSKKQINLEPTDFSDYSLKCSVSGRSHVNKDPIFRHFVEQNVTLFSHDPAVQLYRTF